MLPTWFDIASTLDSAPSDADRARFASRGRLWLDAFMMHPTTRRSSVDYSYAMHLWSNLAYLTLGRQGRANN